MVKVDLKGIHTATAKGRKYWYAWRNGPRLRGLPGSPEFIASYQEAYENRRMPDSDRFRTLVTIYKAREFPNLARSTQKNWRPWLDRITEHFGDLSIAQFDRPEKIRPVIRKWRNRYAETPRTADYGMQVLSRILSYAVDPLGRVGANPCEGIAHLYSANRSDIIWSDADIAQLKAACSPEIAHAVDLAAHTGLRQGDLLLLSWSHVRDDAIVIVTGKSGKQRREAIVPLYDDLRALLDRIPKRATTILTSSLHRPWTSGGFGSSFDKAKDKAKLGAADLHFHDLRGNAATRFYVDGLSERVIAEILGWKEERVSQIIRRYVGRAAATRATIEQLNKRRT